MTDATQTLAPIDTNTFEASFTFNAGTVNTLIDGLAELPAKRSFELMQYLKNSFEQQLFTAQRAREAEIEYLKNAPQVTGDDDGKE